MRFFTPRPDPDAELTPELAASLRAAMPAPHPDAGARERVRETLRTAIAAKADAQSHLPASGLFLTSVRAFVPALGGFALALLVVGGYVVSTHQTPKHGEPNMNIARREAASPLAAAPQAAPPIADMQMRPDAAGMAAKESGRSTAFRARFTGKLVQTPRNLAIYTAATAPGTSGAQAETATLLRSLGVPQTTATQEGEIAIPIGKNYQLLVHLQTSSFDLMAMSEAQTPPQQGRVSDIEAIRATEAVLGQTHLRSTDLQAPTVTHMDSKQGWEGEQAPVRVWYGKDFDGLPLVGPDGVPMGAITSSVGPFAARVHRITGLLPVRFLRRDILVIPAEEAVRRAERGEVMPGTAAPIMPESGDVLLTDMRLAYMVDALRGGRIVPVYIFSSAENTGRSNVLVTAVDASTDPMTAAGQ